MRTQTSVAIVMAFAISACGEKSAPPAQATSASQSTVAAKLDKWSWLPASTRYSAEADSIPKGTQASFHIPREDPLNFKSDGGWGGLDTHGNFVPTDRKSYTVKGGTLISSLGSVQRSAKYGDWDIVYSDVQRTKRAGWGHCLTSGEILMPRLAFGDPPSDMFVQNSYEVEPFGDAFVLIRLDPAKQHKLCFMTNGNSDLSTVYYLGTRAEVGGKVLERKSDGWYAGAVRVSE